MKRRYLASTLSAIALIASTGWTSAYAVTFTPPPGKGAPNQATGGASRGNLFTPPPGKGTPRQATGGASRGNLFTPPPGKGTPRQATGGASRGNLFTPPPGKGTPRQATGGASRVGTYYLNPSTISATEAAALIALLPENFYGTTVSERPTILVYLPESNAQEALFSLKDEVGNMQYQMKIPVAEKTGVIAIKLPANAPALAIGKNYQWFLALKVDGTLSPSTPYVDGWVQRIQPSAELATAMQDQDVLKQAIAFGKNGVWYDCVATLAAAYTAEPSNANLRKQWEELLSSASLKEIVTATLLASSN
ncbi:DUF928 domain-containing protein [Calothrix sp. PCC 7507]|uniref:DUF928 domain-containing protein n=1 Tax=Calothrix sp. PCC 7507 TaxID=99598 RepID=UPI00029F37A9|nr:DUF928 domain-containing protein [Calothrix sp. PCC 7507]AFY34688.1 protein of unknown function DUF928 [Calothrix sp. PCC 7507]